MLQLTDAAVQKVRQLMAAESKPDHHLRVAVQGGGCSGFQYAMSYESDLRENDQVLQYDGLKVLVDPMSLLYLEDVTIDYRDTLQESGFNISNPKATGTCGCGSSFAM